MSEELKPCPFCGSKRVKAYVYHDAVYRQYAVRCGKCGARIMKASTELAIEAWNRRAERTVKVIHKQETHIVTPPKSTTTAYETVANLWTECGNCGAMGMYHGWNYCPTCGVRLEWSDDE